MPDSLNFPSKEPHEIAYHIGVLCIQWSGLEKLLDHVLVRYLDITDSTKQSVLLGALDMRRKISMVKTLAVTKESLDQFAEFEQLLNFTDNTLRPERNRFVHDYYHFTPEIANLTTVKTQIMKSSDGGRTLSPFSSRPVTPSEIKELTDDVEAAAMCAALMVTTVMMDRKKATPEGLRAWDAVYREYFDALKAVMAKYKSRTSAAGSVSPRSSGESS